MGLIALLAHALSDGHARSETGRAGPDRRVRCRNCGRYYESAETACPHCESGNRLRDGPPPL